VGFDLCGIASADALAELAHLPEWLARGYAGEMNYLRDSRRTDPRLVLEGARSIIVVALNYNSEQPHSTEWGGTADDEAPHGWISRYAWGDDYHEVIGDRLETLLVAMRAHFDESFEARAYVDTGPIVERVAAKHAGLGWLAKNTCLINEELGSWLFLGVIVTTLELAPTLGAGELPPADLCGNCTLCLEACPTQAFAAPYLLDARRCISYLTIELRGSIPEELRAAMGGAVFGCDICQEVCPWNRKAPITTAAEFKPREIANGRNSKFEIRNSKVSRGNPDGEEFDDRDAGVDSPAPPHDVRVSMFAPELESLAELCQPEFSEVFRGSAVKRAKWRGIVRNACVALGNARWTRESPARSRVITILERLAHCGDPVIDQHARWAMERLNGAH
jgi:epoxyqueuosine reductase